MRYLDALPEDYSCELTSFSARCRAHPFLCSIPKVWELALYHHHWLMPLLRR